ncbi:MAG: hypothetical protein GWO16_12220, partial [Gammaproteobacteria bacterium]|nr:hypothetical protein [Gammaproteobacteria bacterium]
AGFEREQVRVIVPGDPHLGAKVEPEGAAALGRIIRDVLAGAGLGAALGALALLTAAKLAPAWLSTAPVLGATVIVLYAALVGAIAGAVPGIKPSEGQVAGFVGDSVCRGAYVMVVHTTRDRRERTSARRLLARTRPTRRIAY